MKLSTSLAIALAALGAASPAPVPEPDDLAPRAIGSSCGTTSGGKDYSGTCQYISNCGTGWSVPNHCPGTPNNVQCCIHVNCKVPGGGTGTCRNTNKGCYDGVFETGLCPGDSTIQCCHY